MTKISEAYAKAAETKAYRAYRANRIVETRNRSAEEEEEAHRRRGEGDGGVGRRGDDRNARCPDEKTSVGAAGGGGEGVSRGSPAPLCGGAAAVASNRRLQSRLRERERESSGTPVGDLEGSSSGTPILPPTEAIPAPPTPPLGIDTEREVEAGEIDPEPECEGHGGEASFAGGVTKDGPPSGGASVGWGMGGVVGAGGASMIALHGGVGDMGNYAQKSCI
jgi:hypothetical protein